MPSTPILQARYYSIPGVFTEDFPATPPHKFNYTGSGPKNLQTMKGTRVYRLPYNASVQVILQDTGIISTESHPIHLHGFNFFVVGRGVGNYNPQTSPSTFNLIDPVERHHWSSYWRLDSNQVQGRQPRCVVYALPFRGAHVMGTQDGLCRGQWERT